MPSKFDYFKKIYKYYKKHFSFSLDDFQQYSLNNDVPSILLAMDYILNVLLYGVDLGEYVIYDFFNLPISEKKTYLTRLNKFSIYKKLNPDTYTKKIYDNKDMFNHTFHNFLRREWLVSNDPKSVKDFLNKHSQVILKPINDYGGNGIQKIDTNTIINCNQFIEKIVKNNFLLEEVIVQHDDLKKLNSTSVNTIRIVSVLTDQKTICLSAVIRVGKKGMIVDNASQGGVIYPLDLGSGVINGIGFDKFGNEFHTCPQYEINTIGYKIPSWNEMLKLVESASKILPKNKLVAWDLTINNLGEPLIIEGNMTPGPRTMQIDRKGKREYLKNI